MNTKNRSERWLVTVREIAEAYFQAWNEADDLERRRLLDVCWADDGTLTGPHYEMAGRAAMEVHLDGFQERNPGVRVVTTGGFNAHPRCHALRRAH